MGIGQKRSASVQIGIFNPYLTITGPQDERNGHPDEACEGCEALAEDWQVLRERPAQGNIQPCCGPFRAQEAGQRGEYLYRFCCAREP